MMEVTEAQNIVLRTIYGPMLDKAAQVSVPGIVAYDHAVRAVEAALASRDATIHQLGENAAKAAGECAEEVGRLREALKPFAFLDMGRDEDEGVPFTTQEVWQTIYRDRVQDWISFEELDAARAALTEPTDEA